MVQRGEKRKGKALARHTRTHDVESAPFTYTVKQDTGAKVLVLADEDYTGFNPTYPARHERPALRRGAPGRDPRRRLQRRPVGHRQGRRAARPRRARATTRRSSGTSGDNRYTQDAEDYLIDTGHLRSGELPDIAVAEREQYLTLAVRDFLNEGGKLVHMGELAQDGGLLDGSSSGLTTA